MSRGYTANNEKVARLQGHRNILPLSRAEGPLSTVYCLPSTIFREAA